jgi:Flp pilus assembly protein TadD
MQRLGVGRRARWLALSALVLGAACATQAGQLKTDTYVARKKLARELMARGDWASAFAYADGLHREQPRDAEALLLRGVVYRERGLFTEGEADLRESLRLDDRSAEGHAALGILYDVTLRPDPAQVEHRQAVKLAPGNPGYLNNLAFSLFLQGKTQDAIGYYRQAARLDPTSRRVRTNLGFAYAAAGDLRSAAREFEMGGTAAEARTNLGFAYERRGDMTRAFDLYLEAARLDPRSERARSNLVHAASVLGRPVPDDLAPPPPPLPQPAAPEEDTKETKP